jgi:hypothetical protein
MAEMVEWWMAEWRNGGMGEWRDGGIAGSDGMASIWTMNVAEWRNGEMAGWLPTYYIYGTRQRRQHRHLLIFNNRQADRAYGTKISPRLFVVSFVILLYAILYNICILLFVIM